MPHLFVPPTVARELLEERRRYQAALLNACHKDHICHQWDKELRRLDPYLHLVRAPECFVIGTPLLPGCYHIIRDNPGAPPSVTPITGPDGEFIYPPGSLLERMKSMDLQDVRVDRERQRRQAEADEISERQKLALREERLAHARELVVANTRTQVSMNPDVVWAQNAAGFRRTRGRNRGDG